MGIKNSLYYQKFDTAAQMAALRFVRTEERPKDSACMTRLRNRHAWREKMSRHADKYSSVRV